MRTEVEAEDIPLQILYQNCGENVLHSLLFCGVPWIACVLDAGRKPAEGKVL
jgi:hypothetical protein